MPKISQAAADARRNRILDAAAESFARRGIHVSVDEICAAAGVSKGALYLYFPSKDDIIQGLADRHMADLAPIEGAESLDRLCELLLARTGGDDPMASRLELEAWTYSLNNDPLRQRLQANTARLREAIGVALEGLQRRGVVTLKSTPEACAAVIETFALGLVSQGALADGGEPRNARMKLLLESLTH